MSFLSLGVRLALTIPTAIQIAFQRDPIDPDSSESRARR